MVASRLASERTRGWGGSFSLIVDLMGKLSRSEHPALVAPILQAILEQERHALCELLRTYERHAAGKQPRVQLTQLAQVLEP